MDFQALMAQAVQNTASTVKKIGDHRSRATTQSASTPSSGKMSAEIRQAAVQAQLTKASAPPSHSAGRSTSQQDAKKPASGTTVPSGSKRQRQSSPLGGKPADAPAAPLATVETEQQPLFRTISDRRASNVSSVAAELLREKREKAIAELKAAKHRPPSPRDPRPKSSSPKAAAASAQAGGRSHDGGAAKQFEVKATDVRLPDSLSVPAMEYSRSGLVPAMAPPSKVQISRDDDGGGGGKRERGHGRSKEDQRSGGKEHGHRSREDRRPGGRELGHSSRRDNGHGSSRDNGHGSSPAPAKAKRPAVKPKVKPMDYASLLTAAQANARKVDHPVAAAAAAQSRSSEKKRPPSDDDEPAGRFLLEGPKRVFDKAQVHIKALRTPAEQVKGAPSPGSRSAARPAKPASTSAAAAAATSHPEASRHAGHSQATSADHIRTSDSSMRASSLDSRTPSKHSRAMPPSESRPTSAESRTPSSSGSRSAPSSSSSSSSARPAHPKALTQSTIFGDAVASRPRPSLSASGATQQSRMDSYVAEAAGKKTSAHKAKPPQSRMDAYYESSRRDVPKAAPSGVARPSKPAASNVSQSGGGKRPNPASGESAPKKKKEKKKFGPIWMQEEWSDEDEPEAEDVDVSKYIRRLYGYDRRRFADEDPRDIPMESSWSHIQKEERMSARLGRAEDLEQERLEEEERKRSEARRKRRCIDDDDDDD